MKGELTNKQNCRKQLELTTIEIVCYLSFVVWSGVL